MACIINYPEYNESNKKNYGNPKSTNNNLKKVNQKYIIPVKCSDSINKTSVATCSSDFDEL